MRCKVDDVTDVSNIKGTIKKYQRCRTLALWHDHGTVLGNGLILITTHVIYNTASFLTSEEYQEHTGGPHIDIQTTVEQPEIHMIVEDVHSCWIAGEHYFGYCITVGYVMFCNTLAHAHFLYTCTFSSVRSAIFVLCDSVNL